MVNICVDGNYLFHKTFGIFGGYGNVDPGKILASKKEQGAFIRKITTDLCASLKMIPAGGRLIFTSDSKSWRKDVEIEDGGYKSGRVKDETVDWTIFFDLLHSFGKHLESVGFIYSKVDGAEGDDLLMFWSDYFMGQNENCIIITGDKDLHQLARMNEKAWSLVWNNNSKHNLLTAPSGWKDNYLNKEEETTIFNMSAAIQPDKEKFKGFLKKVQIEEIASQQFILNKILVGDKGDSVPSVWEYKLGDRIFKFTPKKAETVMSAFETSEWKVLDFASLLVNEDFLNWISGLILRTSKDVDNKANRDKVRKNLLRNFTLMWLDKLMIPGKISLSCSEEIKRGLEKPKKNLSIDRIKILEGTEWFSTSYQPAGFDPFENLYRS